MNEINIHSVDLEMPSDKLMCLYDDNYMDAYEYILLEGGRGGGKTEEAARWLLLNSFKHSSGILCTREVQNSIEDSVYKTLLDWIDIMDLHEYFTILKNRIVNKTTGAWFIFKGMQSGTKRDTIKSLKGIKYVWYEEAQTMSKESFEKLDPTIRVEGRKLIFTYNPDSEDDYIEEVKKRPLMLNIQINYYDNPWLPDVLLRQAVFSKKYYPEDYNHIWLGQPRMQGERQTVLPLNLLRRCVDAHLKLGNTDGHAYAGLDLAPGEKKQNDKNSLTARKASVVLQSTEWRSGDLDAIAERVLTRCLAFNVIRLFFDAVGVGGFAEKTLKKRKPPFACIPFMGGSKVFGGDYPYIKAKSYTILNKDFFKNAKAQQWWALRLRMENTIKMLEGDDVTRKSYYLSFDSDIQDMDKFLKELAQATWKEDTSGRVQIDKAPGDHEVVVDGKKVKMRSPNRADSCGMSFVRDFQQRGLRAY